MSETHHVKFDGHRLAYRVAGAGPALVILNLYRRREDRIQFRLLSDAWQVFEIAPLGYGRSDRVPGYAGEALPDQILAVLDHHGVDRFIIWGYSKGGAIAACVARGTSRTAGLVCGGFALECITDTVLRRLDRSLRPDHPGRTLWPWVKRFNWGEELTAATYPSLLYWGSEDRQMAKGLRRDRERLTAQGVDFVEFAGLDHGAFSEEVTGDLVVSAVREWVARSIGRAW